MPALIWLVVAIVAGIAAYTVAWPAWRAYRARDARDTNSERYLAWRGRASPGTSTREGMTGQERRRIYVGAALAVLAAAALVVFFVTS